LQKAINASSFRSHGTAYNYNQLSFNDKINFVLFGVKFYPSSVKALISERFSLIIAFAGEKEPFSSGRDNCL